ncbi:uncharacterized protein PV09_03986 [Verruconis gallopava]|uniref:Uncharacterized protein n=1 Tax=Verruconis gallopava TaxID=253628 RepID=A0A0D2AEA9_9PEZI|nr:uncharacterized protein PV09_03986 [Verruconis gallopava]KIW04800.1 hypothetical protein PV09_03986 [Verruconis gallopava]
MEKIKKILTPGKSVDDELLYGAGHSGSSPSSDRSSKGHGSNIASRGNPAGKPREAALNDADSAFPVATRDYASQEGKRRLLASNATSPPQAIPGAAGEDSSESRPDLSTPNSAASIASIKSNVIGKVPTGMALEGEKEQNALPTVPTTDGKFMSEDALADDSLNPTRSSPFVEPSTSMSHQNAIVSNPDSNFNSSQSGVDPPVEPKTDHHARNAAFGGAGMAEMAAYEAFKSENLGKPESIPQADPARTSEHVDIPIGSGSTATHRLYDDWRLKHMPGAYPETPQYESDKTLEVDRAGVGSGAAVVAAQRAFQKNTSAKETPLKQTVGVETEAIPCTSIEPRVDSAAKQAAVRSTAGGMATSQVSTSRIINPKQNDKDSDVAFDDKLKESEAKRDSHVNEFALAGAAAAATTAAGAYEVSKQRDNDMLSKSDTDPFPAFSEDTKDNVHTEAPNDVKVVQTTIVPSDYPKEREFPLAGTPEQNQGVTNFSYTNNTKNITAVSQESSCAVEDPKFSTLIADTGAAGATGSAEYDALNEERRSDALIHPPHPHALDGYDDQRALPVHVKKNNAQETDANYIHHDTVPVGSDAAAVALSTQESHESKLEKEREEHPEQSYDGHESSSKHARKSEEKHRRSTSKSEDKEHKHGLLHRIMHPRESKEGLNGENAEKTSAGKSPVSPERSTFEEPESKYPVGYSPSSTSEHARHGHERNRLHKDPPPGYISKRDA